MDGKVAVLPRLSGHALETFTKQALTQAKRDRTAMAQELKEILEILFAISKIENTKTGRDINLSGPGC